MDEAGSSSDDAEEEILRQTQALSAQEYADMQKQDAAELFNDGEAKSARLEEAAELESMRSQAAALQEAKAQKAAADKAAQASATLEALATEARVEAERAAEAAANAEAKAQEEGGLYALSIKQLKAVAVAYDVDVSECTEKRDLVEKLHAKGVNAETAGAPPKKGAPPAAGGSGPGAGGGGATNNNNNNASSSSSRGSSSSNANSSPSGPDSDEAKAKAADEARLQAQRAAKVLQEELKRLEPREALSGVLGGAAIVAGGTAASVGMVIVLPAVAGYQKGIGAYLGVLLGTTVTVVFVETGFAIWGASHIVNGILNTPKTAFMLAAGYEYDDVEDSWVNPSDGTVLGGARYSLSKEAAHLEALEKAAEGASAGSKKDEGQENKSRNGNGGDEEAAKKTKTKGSGFVNSSNQRGLEGRKVKDYSLYNSLEVPADASAGDVKKAYYKMARKFHPDKNVGDSSADAKFQEVGVAYQILSNDKARRDYDHAGRPDEKDASNGGSRIDPGTMFTMMFGSDQFDPYLGTLAAASMADRVARPPDEAEEQRQQATAKRRLAAIQRQETRKAKAAAMNVPFDPEEKDSEDERDAKLEAEMEAEEMAAAMNGETYRTQRKREVKAALALVERIQPFVDARILEGEEWDADTKIRRLKAWEDAMTSEASSLANAPFGEQLLRAMAWAYANVACRYHNSSTYAPGSVEGFVDDFASLPVSTLYWGEGGSRHAGRYMALFGSASSVFQVSASADLSDPLSGDKVQASAFELLAATTLMDVETTCLAVAKRCLTDSGAGVSEPTFMESMMGTAAAKAVGAGPPTAKVLEARGLALKRLAQIYSTAKTTNPDPYSWREAFAAAASGRAR